MDPIIVGNSKFQVQLVLPPVAKVTLLDANQFPLHTLGIVTRGYTGNYTAGIEVEEMDEMVEQIARTKLQTPLRFVNLVFLVNNVTRAFTHQAVRYQIGISFVQESLRFVDKRQAQVLISPEVAKDATLLSLFTESMGEQFDTYAKMIEAGVPIQDARGTLPHHVLTNLFVSVNLATLAHIYEQRTCCQAQHLEWLSVVEQMRDCLPEELQQFLKKPWETGAVSCGFGATFDRPCKFQGHFDSNLAEILRKRGIRYVQFNNADYSVPLGQLAETLEAREQK